MTEVSQILTEKRGRALWITLNRPQAKNALTRAMVRELSVALDKAENDDEIRAVVLTGAGGSFCAGVDIKDIGSGAPADNIRAFMDVATPVFDRIETTPIPVIAAVRGFALAGGLELLLCCDLIVADDSAKIGDSHANFGLVPGGGSGVRLTQRLGPLRARELLFTGDVVKGERLVTIGLVNRLTAPDQLEHIAQELAEKIAAKSPLGIARMKTMVMNALTLPAATALIREVDICVSHTASDDAAEGFRAFAERRPPKFTGR